MDEDKRFEVCECTPVEDTLFLCSSVKLPQTKLESVYIGPTGAYVILDDDNETDLSALRGFLRNFLGTARVEIYKRGNGRFLAFSNGFEPPMEESSLEETIFEHIQHGAIVLWPGESLERIVDKIRYEDARNRGVYRDTDGNWFVEKNGKFRPVSDHDSTRILRLTLFGGIFGIHRFALGKWFTGLVYLFTGGLMGLGWFMDLVQLSFGTMTDKKKRLLPKPEPMPIPWYLAGFVVSFVLFCVFSLSTGLITGTLEQISQSSAQNVDPNTATNLISILESFSGK